MVKGSLAYLNPRLESQIDSDEKTTRDIQNKKKTTTTT